MDLTQTESLVTQVDEPEGNSELLIKSVEGTRATQDCSAENAQQYQN